MANRLARSASAYLRAHAENPVDWFPWGDEAFEQARERDVPIFLSIGYSSCHWCHVMAHESFEDPRVAAMMNEMFVNVKVDREELPAIDARYMQATQALTGHGGWPMSVWLDHERRAWFAGTYFPPAPSHGSPGFMQVLVALSDAWKNERDKVMASATHIDDALRSMTGSAATSNKELLDVSESLRQTVNRLAMDFDHVHGGFGSSPKFPPSLVLKFLLRWHGFLELNGHDNDPRVLAMVESTCTRMALGGMYDQLGGGFARYSVDREWVVPHFEKMLYDNAQLLDVYTRWYLATGDPLAQRIACEVAEFIQRDLTTAEGGYAASFDADSPDASGHMAEGAYYEWQRGEVIAAADEQLANFLSLTQDGVSRPLVLSRHDDEQLMRARSVLLPIREQRKKPARDDKIVCAWNALAIDAMARAACVFGRPEWLDSAVRAADLLTAVHLVSDTSLVRVSQSGVVADLAPGTLEDYSLLALAYTTLAQATGESEWLELALSMIRLVQSEFVIDDELKDTSERVLQQLGLGEHFVDITDNVTPSGWSSALDAALAIAGLTGDSQLRTWVDSLTVPLQALVPEHARFAGNAAAVLTALSDGPREVAVDAPAGSYLHALAMRTIAPGAVVAAGNHLPLMVGRDSGSGAVFVCRHFVCDAPLLGEDAVRNALGVR